MKRQGSLTAHIWPGFIDALTALLTVILFAFMIFVISYVYVYSMVRKKESSLEALSVKTEQLKKEITHKDKTVSHMKHQLVLKKEEIERLEKLIQQLRQMIGEKDQIVTQKTVHMTTQEQQLREKERQLEDLNAQLQALLAKQLHEPGSRSEFFGKLQKALGDRKDIRIVGDRFIFQSEVLFALGSADINAQGEHELAAFARALKEVMESIPSDVAWVVRVDGHTDHLPIRQGGKFKSNLELSTARAISVVNFLIGQGIPPQRLAAAGFGEFRPLISGHPSEKDRRIELLLDQGY